MSVSATVCPEASARAGSESCCADAESAGSASVAPSAAPPAERAKAVAVQVYDTAPSGSGGQVSPAATAAAAAWPAGLSGPSAWPKKAMALPRATDVPEKDLLGMDARRGQR